MTKTRMEIMVGTHISEAAKTVTAEAMKRKCRVEAMFNETLLYADPTDGWAVVEKRWNDDFEAKAKAFSESPEGIARARQRAQDAQDRLDNAKAFIAEMQVTDLADLPAVMRLFDKSHCVGYINTHEESAEFVRLLAKAGYKPNVFCGDAYVADDPEISARWLIGQAMTMPGHGIEQKFAREWLGKFSPEEAWQ